MLSFEEGLKKAFELAESYNVSKGLGRRHISDMRKTRADGTVWTGPTSYKTTIYWSPWTYVSLNEARANSDRPGQGLTTFIIKLVEKHLKQAAERPPLRAIKGAKAKERTAPVAAVKRLPRRRVVTVPDQAAARADKPIRAAAARRAYG